MSNNFVYIIMHGMYYEYNNIVVILSNYESAKEQLKTLLVKYEKEQYEKYVEIKKDYWEYDDRKYFYIQKHEVFD